VISRHHPKASKNFKMNPPCRLSNILLAIFLCLVLLCKTESKGQAPYDGFIDIDETLKGEVIEGSGRYDNDIDEESSGGNGLEDDEDTPLTSFTPSSPRSGGSRSVDATLEGGSGERKAGKCVDRDSRCNRYFSDNRCTLWVTWMGKYCPKTCGFCTPKRKKGKKNKNDDGDSKVPTKSSNQPTKPGPTKFTTRYDDTESKGHDDKTNMIHHEGGTYFDKTNEPKDDYMPNEVPSIGKAVMGPKQHKAESSLWTQPGILAGIIGAAVVGLLCAVLLVMFIVYRMKKKDEGSYDLDETTKRSPRINGYQRTNQNEFYA
jgi:hypothetical protein